MGLALLAACHVAVEIILPIVLAFVLMLVLQPVMRLFEKLRLPRMIGALAIIIVLFGSIVGLGAALSGPPFPGRRSCRPAFPGCRGA